MSPSDTDWAATDRAGTSRDGAVARVDKVVRVVATSTVSWEDAARQAVTEASKTVRDLFVAQVETLDLAVHDGTPIYRVRLRMAFRVDRRRSTASGVVDVRRYLVVADTTLHSTELRDLVAAYAGRGPSEFHVLVPRDPAPFGVGVLADPLTGYVVPVDAGAGADADGRAAAEERLDDFLGLLRQQALAATGEIGPANPVRAVQDVLARGSFDEVIVSTLPSSVSRWLRMDLPSRLARATGLPVTHVESLDGQAAPAR